MGGMPDRVGSQMSTTLSSTMYGKFSDSLKRKLRGEVDAPAQKPQEHDGVEVRFHDGVQD